jgi:hypothetical protein
VRKRDGSGDQQGGFGGIGRQRDWRGEVEVVGKGAWGWRWHTAQKSELEKGRADRGHGAGLNLPRSSSERFQQKRILVLLEGDLDVGNRKNEVGE